MKSILVILKEYAMSIAYPKVKVDDDNSLHERYDEWFVSEYDNGRLYINEDFDE